jgi:hypothetical protein
LFRPFSLGMTQKRVHMIITGSINDYPRMIYPPYTHTLARFSLRCLRFFIPHFAIFIISFHDFGIS